MTDGDIRAIASLRPTAQSLHTDRMGEHEDYTDDTAAHGRESPLLNVVFYPAIGLVLILAGILTIAAINGVFGEVTKGEHAPLVQSEPGPAEPALSPVDQRVKELCGRINDNPDMLRFDYTPAVHGLIEIGAPAISPALDLMLSDDQDTRLRAERVLEGVTLQDHGFVFGQGWKKPEGEEEWRQFWKHLGSMHYKASRQDRIASIALWRAWLAERQKAQAADKASAPPKALEK